MVTSRTLAGILDGLVPLAVFVLLTGLVVPGRIDVESGLPFNVPPATGVLARSVEASRDAVTRVGAGADFTVAGRAGGAMPFGVFDRGGGAFAAAS